MKLQEVLLTGSFGVMVAIVTWILAGLRESVGYKRELKRERINKLESVYAQTISQLEQVIRITEAGESYEDSRKPIADNNAHLILVSTKAINDQLEKVTDLMYQWSSTYRKGAPNRVGDSNMVIISSQDSKSQKQAKELFPKLNGAIVELIEHMKSHLDDERKA